MKKSTSIFSLMTSIGAGLAVSVVTAGAIVAHGMSQADTRRQQMLEYRSISRETGLSGAPMINQSSIDLATKAFAIQIPKGVRGRES